MTASPCCTAWFPRPTTPLPPRSRRRQWGEMDAYGHVNNTVYFRYFESARIQYFGRCGLLDSYHKSSVGAILHSTSCRFRLALRYPDTALIGTRVSDVQDDRFTMLYRVVSKTHNTVAAE